MKPVSLVLLPALLAGCSTPCGDFTATGTEITGVVELSWQTEEAASATISYGVDGLDDTLVVDDSPTTSHSVKLLGLPALSEIAFEVVNAFGKKEQVCEGSFETSNLPSELASLETTTLEADKISSERYLLGSIMTGGQAGILYAIDREANYRWYHIGADDVQTAHVQFDRNSNDILFNGVDPKHAVDVAAIYRVTLEGTLTDSVRTELAHHVFYQHEDGTFVYPTADIRDWTDPESGEVLSVVGDTLVEQAPDGTTRAVWSAWDNLPIERNDAWDDGFYAVGEDWTHGNAVTYDEATDSYLFSMGNVTTLVQIDRSTGETLDIISPNTYTIDSDSTIFSFQHDGQWTEDGNLLLLSHGTTGTQPIEYEIDQDAKTLHQVWTYHAEPSTSFLGQVDRLSNGNTLINYGGLGLIREVTPDLEVVWQLELGVGYWFGNMQTFDDFYTGE